MWRVYYQANQLLVIPIRHSIKSKLRAKFELCRETSEDAGKGENVPSGCFFFIFFACPEELVSVFAARLSKSKPETRSENRLWTSRQPPRLTTLLPLFVLLQICILVLTLRQHNLNDDCLDSEIYRQISSMVNKVCLESPQKMKKSKMGISETSARATPEMLNTWTIKNGRKYLVVTTENWWAKLGPCWKHFTSLRKPLSSSNADKNKNCAIIYIKSATMARSPHQFV